MDSLSPSGGHPRHLLVVLLLALLVNYGCPGGGGDRGAGPSANVNGTITDGRTGEPIADAIVQTADGCEATSLTDGSYQFFHPAGEIEVMVQASGYISPGAVTLVVLEAGVTRYDFELIAEGRNLPPLAPVPSAPEDGSLEVPLHASFRLAPFEDADIGERHTATQWQISIGATFGEAEIIVDQKSDLLLTEFSPQLILMPERTYFWRARFYDVADEASPWSVAYRFDTATDSDDDGIPDGWEVHHGLDPLDPGDADLDPDGNGLTHRETYYLNPEPGRNDPQQPGGTLSGLLKGEVYDADSGAPLSARLVTDGGVWAETLEDGFFLLVHGAGCYALNATAAGYYPRTLNQVCIEEGAVAHEEIALEEIRPSSGGGSSGGGCFVAALNDHRAGSASPLFSQVHRPPE